MKKIVQSTAKVRFQDCDPFNHLNNSKYIDYFINAREDQILEYYNLDIYTHIQQFGKAWLVASNQIAYVKPAKTMEEVLIESQLIHHTKDTLYVEMKMWNSTKTALKSIFWTSFIYFDVSTQKKAEHPQDLVDLFTQIVEPVAAKTFEDRSKEILIQLKTAKNKPSSR